MIECGCNTAVTACDGCVTNSAAAAVTASALILRKVLISSSLQAPAALGLLCALESRPFPDQTAFLRLIL
jgi:hypothetical protein